jgi:hypothetical protein
MVLLGQGDITSCVVAVAAGMWCTGNISCQNPILHHKEPSMPRRAIPVILWTLLVLYPNPARLLAAIHHAVAPPIDAAAVRDLAATLPDDPRAIERLVNSSIVRYEVPWQTYGVPWYFPTTREVLERGVGDCQARAIVFASILEAKGIDATLVGSFDHLWVEYPGKHENALENRAVALVVEQPGGGYDLRWPQLVEWRKSWEIERAYFWDAMPGWRFHLLMSGWIVFLWRGNMKRWIGFRAGWLRHKLIA